MSTSAAVKKKKFSFIRIISSSTIRDQRLGLPKKFIRKVGNSISNVVILRNHNGDVWRVEVKKFEDTTWFINGWQEFAQYHSIAVGYFLFFTYDGNSHFDVVLFDMSGSEQMYPHTTANSEEPNHGQVPESPYSKENQANSLETLGDSPRNFQEEGDVPVTDKCSYNKASTTSSKRVTTQEKDDSIPLAMTLEHPSFTVVIEQSYILHRYMKFPFGIVMNHLTKGSSTIQLQVSDGQSTRTWSVGFQFQGGARKSWCSPAGATPSTYARFRKGWMTFARENSLRAGDTCVFKVVKENVLKVHILRRRR